MRKTNLTVVGVAVAGLLTTWAGPAPAGAGNSTIVGVGPDYVNPDPSLAPNPLANAVVLVSAREIGSGNLQITLDVSGIEAPAGTRLGAHIHTNPCGTTASASGGHYQNPAGGTPLEQREVWLDFAVTANGTGHSVATRDWLIPNFSERSLVIHVSHTDHQTGVAGARFACTDID
jgi:superoxide dismutase, Cu-Zn family